MADWLQARGILAPKAIDWGVAPVLVLLSNSRIQPQNCSDFTRPGLPMARQEFLSQCADEDSRYVFVEGPECSRDRVSALLKATGKRLVEEKVFFTRNGERAYSIYSVKQRPEGSIGANSKRLKAKTD